MKNLIFIYFIIILLSACNTPENEAVKDGVEKEMTTVDIPSNIEGKQPAAKEEVLIDKKENLKLTKPYGKLLYMVDRLFIYENKAALNGTVLYDADAELAQLIKEEGGEDGECEVNYVFNHNPLSLVGTYYSYESVEGGSYACGPPGSSLSVTAINTETLKPVEITDLFTENSMMTALKKDTWVLRQAKEYSKNLNEINDFNDFLEGIMSSGETRLGASDFAILDFNKETNLAAVRLIGTKYMGFNHYEYFQLGIWVEPIDVKMFREKSYFYLDRFENGIYE